MVEAREMPQIPKSEYLRRRKLQPADMTGREWCAWWDFPNEWRGFADVEIGGKSVYVDFTNGSVPTVIRRAYLPY